MSSTNNGQPRSGPYTIALGVTGHRFLRRLDELVPRIDAVLDSIEAEWPGAMLTVISSLAEGSDRLVVARVLCRYHARLVVPLPLPEALYLEDFQSASSRQEFLKLLAQADEIVRFPVAATRPAGYAAAGHYLLNHCDLLVALWDGQPAQGDGGTGAVVAAARQLRLPIAWIYTHNHKAGYAHPPSAKPQGAVIFENF
jgi:hypothetical protein